MFVALSPVSLWISYRAATRGRLILLALRVSLTHVERIYRGSVFTTCRVCLVSLCVFWCHVGVDFNADADYRGSSDVGPELRQNYHQG